MDIPNFIGNSTKPPGTQKVINQALYILKTFGLPFEGLSKRRLEKMAMAFLAVANVQTADDWPKVQESDSRHALKSRDIIVYVNDNFQETISPGSYDDIRRKDLKLPVLARIIVQNVPDTARNNPTRAYVLAPEFAMLIRDFGKSGWEAEVAKAFADCPSLTERLDAERILAKVPVVLPSGKRLTFSPGVHNQLQQAIIEEFLPRYGHGAQVLYVGDAADRFLHIDNQKLQSLRFFELAHGELPDVIAYSEQKNWLYLVEAVHTSGPISQTRLLELQNLTQECTAEIIFVTAFPDRNTFRKFAPAIAWETEVWIADIPDHLIHFDGERFFGPYKKPD